MHDHGVEHQAVARRHRPPADVVLGPIGVDVGDLREIARGELDLVALAEGRRPVVDAPAVRAGDELDGAVAAVDRIERDPDRGDLPALHRPVGLVLVPRRRMRRARLLHEELVVEEIGRAGAHQPRGDCRGRGVQGGGTELRIAPPHVHVAEEPAGVLPSAKLVAFGPGEARSRSTAARMRSTHGAIERLAQADDAVAVVGGDVVVR